MRFSLLNPLAVWYGSTVAACLAFTLELGCSNGQQEAAQPSDASVAVAHSISAVVSAPPVLPSPLPSMGPLPSGLVANASRTAPPIAIDPEASAACPPGMLLVTGEYCPTLVHTCLEFIDVPEEWKDKKGTAQRCLRYAPTNRCFGEPQKRRFCIDRYEYPNLPGVKPVVMTDWYDAMGACEIEGKRLCLSSEWELACEGNERLPYPYGNDRDKRLCNIDRPRPYPEPDFNLFALPRKVGTEVARLDLRVESARLEGCVSPFGVRDMTGNVDEWVINEEHFNPPPGGKKPPYISGLKGGYWGPIRARCRPMTTSHNEIFRLYQVGFRCCASAKDKPDGRAEQFLAKMTKWREKLAR